MKIIRTSHLSELGRAAVAYAERGWPVLPCRPRGKDPLIARWTERATTDHTIVVRWWTRWPDANVGLLTGAPGPDVLDIDLREGGDGFDVLRDLERRGLLTGASRVVRTPSGGEHWYFRGSEQRKSTLPDRFVDFQARGGYVLAPPSRLKTDGHAAYYEQIHDREGDLVLNWTEVSGVTRPPHSPSRPSAQAPGQRGRGLRGLVRHAREGERNKTLFYAANRFLDAGRDPSILLLDAMAAGLSKDEALETIGSARRQRRRGRSRLGWTDS